MMLRAHTYVRMVYVVVTHLVDGQEAAKELFGEQRGQTQSVHLQGQTQANSEVRCRRTARSDAGEQRGKTQGVHQRGQTQLNSEVRHRRTARSGAERPPALVSRCVGELVRWCVGALVS